MLRVESPVSEPSHAPAQHVGPYTLIEPLGEGGMARVYLAQRDGASDLCVLKLLHADLQTHGEAARRFQREAHIASQLAHANIAPVLDAGFEGERFYLTMPLIEGETAEALLNTAQGRGLQLPLALCLGIADQALAALHYAHTFTDSEDRPLGLVHRDLSPRNVMVSYSGRVSIIDFGVAKGQVDDFRTASGVLMGTPFYMSPEQAQAFRVDHRSDQYTFAAVLYELLTGRRTSSGKGRSGVLLSVVREVPAPVSSLNPNLPSALDPVLARALEKEPERRYPSAEAFRRALREAAGPQAPYPETEIATFIQDLFPEAEAQVAARRARLLSVYPHPLEDPSTTQLPTRTATMRTQLDTPPTRILLPPTQVLPARSSPPAPRLAGLAALLTLGGLAAVLILLSTAPKETLAPAPAPKPPSAPPAPVRAVPGVFSSPSVAARPAAVRDEASPPATVARPAPAPAAAPAPTPPSPAPMGLSAQDKLRQRLVLVERTRDKAGALELARDLAKFADTLEPSRRNRVRAEVDRVYLTGDLDTMVSALQDALRAVNR